MPDCPIGRPRIADRTGHISVVARHPCRRRRLVKIPIILTANPTTPGVDLLCPSTRMLHLLAGAIVSTVVLLRDISVTGLGALIIVGEAARLHTKALGGE